MKFTTVTDKNLHLIKHRFEQFVKRHPAIQDTWHYPTQARRNKNLPEDERRAEKSMTSVYFRNEIKVTIQQVVPSRPRYVHIYFNYDKDKATCIHIGDKVKITSTQVVHIHEHPTHRHENAKTIFKPHNY